MVEFRELSGLPAYGPLPLQFSGTGQGMHREGFVVEFFSGTNEVWIGNFQPGAGRFCAAIAHPDGKRVIVISGGEAYVVDPQARVVAEQIGGAIEFATHVSGIDVVVLGDGISFDIVWPNGRRATTRRISWDGMQDIEIVGSCLRGNAYDPVNDSSVPFEVNLLDATHVGGSYPPN